MALTSADVDQIVSLETEVKKLEEQLVAIVYIAPALTPVLDADIEELKAEIKANEVHADRASYVGIVQPLKDRLKIKMADNETIKAQNKIAMEAAQADYINARAQVESSLAAAKESLSNFLASVVVP